MALFIGLISSIYSSFLVILNGKNDVIASVILFKSLLLDTKVNISLDTVLDTFIYSFKTLTNFFNIAFSSSGTKDGKSIYITSLYKMSLFTS